MYRLKLEEALGFFHVVILRYNVLTDFIWIVFFNVSVFYNVSYPVLEKRSEYIQVPFYFAELRPIFFR